NTRNLSIEAVTKSKEYDAGPHTVADTEYSIAAGSLADGDSIRSIDVYNAGEATRVGETESSKAKDIVIKNSANADVTSDYAVTYIDGELTFTKRSITITAKDHNKTYDGTALTAGVPSIVMSLSDSNNNYYTVGTPGLATGDKVSSITVSGSQLTNGSSDATPQAARIVHAGVDVTGCYDITYVPGTLSVQKRNITLTAKNHSKVYDGTPLSYSGTYNADESLYTIGGQGLGEGDEVISFTLTGSITDAGEAPLVPSDLLIKAGDEDRTGNYNITYVNGKVKVTNAGLTVTAKEISKEYDKAPLTYSDKTLSEKLAAVTLTGLNAGDEVTAITLTGSITNAGERALVPSAVTISRGGEDVTESYTINYVNGKLIIDKRPITVTAANTSGMYGTAPSTLTYTITGGSEVTSADAGISLTCSARATSDVGGYDITPVISSANYVLTPVVGTYMVTARPIIIQAKDATEKYVPGINLQKNGYEIASGSLASGDAIESVTVTGNLDTVGSAANVASNAVIKKGSRDVTGNYQISYFDGMLTVEKGIQQIIASDKSVEYNGQSHDASEIERKLKYEDDVTIEVENPDDSILTAGEMEVTFKTAETALFMGSTKTVKLTVTKRAITITADSAKKTYDGQPLTKESYKVTKGSLAEGDVITEDSLTVRADNEEGSITKPGKVVNKISGDAVIMHDNTDVSGSYEITYKDGKLVVKKKEVKSGSDDGSDTKESTVDPGSVSPKKGEKDPSDNNEEDSTSDPGKQPGKKKTDPEEGGSDSGGSDSDNGHSSGSETGNKDNEPGDESAEDKGLVKYIVGTKSDEELEPSDGSRKEDIVDCEVVDADIERMIEELLTLDEKVRVEKYNPLRFRVEVKKDELVRTDDVENSIREKLPENYRIVGTFDARFFVKIGDEAEKLIGKNYSSVKTSFMIPEEMWDDTMVGKSQILRTYRDDKGRLVTEVILAEVEGQSVVMDVDNFSSYTLVTEAMVVTDVHHCYIHWLILLLFFIAVLDIVVFYRIGKDDEKDGKKDKKPARIRHYVILIGLNGLGIVLVFFGSCSWDLFMAVISVLATTALETLERRRREKNRKRNAA
ncbi:MAG: hypothetical protein K6G10_04915, partial [Butyrivibrio sp.]|nr:hypothetical protein [Butyrivibrio sp.]